MDIQTYQFKYPVIIGEGEKQKEYREVDFRSPKGRDLKLLDESTAKNSWVQEYRIIAACTGLPLEVIEEAEAEDVYGLRKLMLNFLAKAASAASTG